MADVMTFPDTVEEFMESYKVTDTEGIYMSKGAELIPIFRMRQWFEHKPERKKGKWTEKHHAYSDEESIIEEWQSCRCSECGRYDTRPYMYFFSEPNYCSYCGADMRGKERGKD